MSGNRAAWPRRDVIGPREIPFRRITAVADTRVPTAHIPTARVLTDRVQIVRVQIVRVHLAHAHLSEPAQNGAVQ